MSQVLKIIGAAAGRAVQDDTGMDIVSVVILAVWLFFVVRWLYKTRLATVALTGIRTRRNDMQPYTPFIPFGVWVILGAVCIKIMEPRALSEEAEAIYVLITTGLVSLIALFIVLAIVDRHFVRTFRGFGLKFRTLRRDFLKGALRLAFVYPVILIMLGIIVLIGQHFYGPHWEIEKHEELEVLSKFSDWPFRILVIFMTVVVAPIFEEMLFRGLIQTMFRNYVGPWIAICGTAILFAAAHANVEHMPALFCLAVALGYAYERSGSIFQSMSMHALFNGIAIFLTILQG
jgi:membrane protease YdiL (CAAX protease family)